MTPTSSVEAVHASPMLVVVDDVTRTFEGTLGGCVSPGGGGGGGGGGPLHACVVAGYQMASPRTDLFPAASTA